jgi:hypothetical protein
VRHGTGLAQQKPVDAQAKWWKTKRESTIGIELEGY